MPFLGAMCLCRRFFEELSRVSPGYGGEIQLTDGLNALCKKERVMALDFDGRRYDSGNLKGYIETIIDFALEHPETGPWLKQFLQNKTL